MKKTKHEKAVSKLARVVLDAADKRAGDIIKSYVDVSAMMAFKFLADELQAVRESYEKDFKEFCKTNGFTQYKVKDIESAAIGQIDLNVFKQYVTILNMQKAVDDWVNRFPNIARKYGITVENPMGRPIARLLLGRTRVEVWRRGEDYANKGRVRILDYDENQVKAIVSGTQNYEVFLKLLARGMRKQCTCPYASGDVCKHMVATALIWDNIRGFAPLAEDKVEMETIHPPPISRKQIAACYARPLKADLDIIRVATDYYNLSPKEHARLPRCPRIETYEKVPLTLTEVKGSLKEMERWTKRKTYHHYFCAGEMAAAFSELLDVIYSRLPASKPDEAISIVAYCVNWRYRKFEQVADGSDGVWIFPVARIGRIVAWLLKKYPTHPAWQDFNRTIEDVGHCWGEELNTEIIANWKYACF
jgi:hypothetical protein